jgi:hypothetical protein
MRATSIFAFVLVILAPVISMLTAVFVLILPPLYKCLWHNNYPCSFNGTKEVSVQDFFKTMPVANMSDGGCSHWCGTAHQSRPNSPALNESVFFNKASPDVPASLHHRHDVAARNPFSEPHQNFASATSYEDMIAMEQEKLITGRKRD